jgi:hypothetical protein
MSTPYAVRAETQTDGRHIGSAIKEIVRLQIEEGLTWQRAADAVGLKRTRAHRALHKSHVITYRRKRQREEDELRSANVSYYLHQIMTTSQNDAARTRAALALQQIGAEARAEPGAGHHLTQNGIVIVIGNVPQRSLPPAAAPTLELAPVAVAAGADE